MRKLVNCRLDDCVGCNRCVRACPVDEANVMVHANGKVAVTIDENKCIACGACLTACHHGARHYEDDTENFLRDLERGVKIDVLVDPEAWASFGAAGGAENLAAWLRSLGAQRIFDASLGAEICTWAHLRYMQGKSQEPIISQHCPVVVNYVLTYKKELAKRLSPIHSPMLCTAVYMRKYEETDARIAVLSPCVAKAHEFEAAGFVDYNVTINHLMKRVNGNGTGMSSHKSGFDVFKAGLCSLRPSRSSFGDNIGHCIEKPLRIDKAEGRSLVYKALDEYASQPEQVLPALFNVQSCIGGCSLGTGCGGGGIFEVNAVMDGLRQSPAQNGKKRHLEKLFEIFDCNLQLSDFLRKHEQNPVKNIKTTLEQVGEAFAWLGKFDEESMNYDCGACGCDTCLEMAERIAKGVATPILCMEKAKLEAQSAWVS
ncbi:MAG: 4Fe-4S binding protein [Clostridiales bacterium]|nr:4Fe-4S binding protein [Clostridiales bacterium]